MKVSIIISIFFPNIHALIFSVFTSTEKTHGYEWNVRYKIIQGICQGLHYIHQERINHLDLKPANVLLGANMEPKITDFGVSRCISEEQGTMVTKFFFGTL